MLLILGLAVNIINMQKYLNYFIYILKESRAMKTENQERRKQELHCGSNAKTCLQQPRYVKPFGHMSSV